MDEQEFNRQYDKARYDRAQRNLDLIMCFGYFDGLSAVDLWISLLERIEEHVNIDSMEISVILGVICDRLERLEEIEGATGNALLPPSPGA